MTFILKPSQLWESVCSASIQWVVNWDESNWSFISTWHKNRGCAVLQRTHGEAKRQRKCRGAWDPRNTRRCQTTSLTFVCSKICTWFVGFLIPRRKPSHIFSFFIRKMQSCCVIVYTFSTLGLVMWWRWWHHTQQTTVGYGYSSEEKMWPCARLRFN